MMCINQCDYPSDDGGPCRCELDARNSMKTVDLVSAVKARLGGVGAISRERYLAALQDIANAVGRTIDDEFKSEVAVVLQGMPCPLD